MNEDLRELIKEVVSEIHKERSPSGYSIVLLVLLSAGSTGLGVNYISKEESTILSNISLSAEKEIREATDNGIQRQIRQLSYDFRQLEGDFSILTDRVEGRIDSIERINDDQSNKIDFIRRGYWEGVKRND